MSCAFAACALIAGPGVAGTAVAHAGLFGIGPDIFDLFGDDGKRSAKSDMHHPRPDAGTGAGAQASRSTARVAAAEAPSAKVGSTPENADMRQFAAAATDNGAARSGRRGGGDGVPRTNAAVRGGNLPAVSTAPVTRSIVIRGTPSGAGRSTAPARELVPAEPVQTPAVAPLAALPPVQEVPENRPAPAGPPAPSPQAPLAKDPGAPDNSGVGRIPDSYRVGYREYLRSATTADLFRAALPGVAGIAGFTVVGAYAGYRQAKAVQQALLAPVPTRIVL